MRIIEDQITGDNKHISTIFGGSGESKPTTGLADGSVFVETDTGKVYLFSESGSSWTEMA